MRLLDLYCGAGGAAWGYHLAGFEEIVGVDCEPQPRYPFEFVRADALAYAEQHGREFDVIHASPVCKGYSNTARIWGREYPLQVPATRECLQAVGVPYVIENVVGAPLEAPVLLCGTMFDRRFYRHRLFESSVWLLAPGHPRHVAKTALVGRRVADGEFMCIAGHFADVDLARAEMGIPWMTRYELSQAVPPAYTEWIGGQVRAALGAGVVVAGCEVRGISA